MGYENASILEGSHSADADLSAKQYFAVKITSGGINLCGAGDAGGILQNKPTLAQQSDVSFDGVSKGIAGAAFARGVELASNASGKLITALTTNKVIAIALQAAGADGDIVAVKIVQNGRAA